MRILQGGVIAKDDANLEKVWKDACNGCGARYRIDLIMKS
jgi:hypothetical protein